MADLRIYVEKLGFAAVKTYLNSGNIVFSSIYDDKQRIAGQFEEMIKARFNLTIPAFVISTEELNDILQHTPKWWGNEDKEIYDNIIFMIKPADFQQVYDEIGAPRDDLEQIENYRNAIFWSFSRKDYQKTNWWSKTANAGIRSKLTIRTAGTVRKLCSM